MKPIKLNKSYIHNRTNKKYYTQDFCRLKFGMGWFDCVIYSNHNGEKFVRNTADFRENFSEY